MVDDAHELASAEALAQLELLIMRAPQQLRFVLATRHYLRLGLHRPRPRLLKRQARRRSAHPA